MHRLGGALGLLEAHSRFLNQPQKMNGSTLNPAGVDTSRRKPISIIFYCTSFNKTGASSLLNSMECHIKGTKSNSIVQTIWRKFISPRFHHPYFKYFVKRWCVVRIQQILNATPLLTFVHVSNLMYCTCFQKEIQNYSKLHLKKSKIQWYK